MSSNLQHLATRKRQHHFNEESVCQIALMQIEAAKIEHHAADRDRRIIVRQDNRPRVEFFPVKMRWIEAGNPKRFSGDAVMFIDWLRERAGVLK